MDPDTIKIVQEIAKACFDQTGGAASPGWLKGLLSFLAVNVFGLNAKIAYDSYQSRKQPPAGGTTVKIHQSPDHVKNGDRCGEHLNRILAVESEVHTIRPMLERFDERSQSLIKRLEGGDTKFDILAKNINKLCTGMKVMATKMETLNKAIEDRRKRRDPDT
jgi:hypothetical protein